MRKAPKATLAIDKAGLVLASVLSNQRLQLPNRVGLDSGCSLSRGAPAVRS